MQSVGGLGEPAREGQQLAVSRRQGCSKVGDLFPVLRAFPTELERQSAHDAAHVTGGLHRRARGASGAVLLGTQPGNPVTQFSVAVEEVFGDAGGGRDAGEGDRVAALEQSAQTGVGALVGGRALGGRLRAAGCPDCRSPLTRDRPPGARRAGVPLDPSAFSGADDFGIGF